MEVVYLQAAGNSCRPGTQVIAGHREMPTLLSTPRRPWMSDKPTEVAQPESAAIATARMGTEVLCGIYRAGASMRQRHRVGSHGRGRLGVQDGGCNWRRAC